MRQSIFNTHVPLADDQVFLMNTFNRDAQLVVSSDVLALLNRLAGSSTSEMSNDAASDDVETSTDFSEAEFAVLQELREHGFVVDTRESERAALDKFFVEHKNSNDELHLTVLTTLQCNFACDYCLRAASAGAGIHHHPRADRDGHARLLLGPVVHQTDLHVDPGHGSDRGRATGRPRGY